MKILKTCSQGLKNGQKAFFEPFTSSSTESKSENFETHDVNSPLKSSTRKLSGEKIDASLKIIRVDEVVPSNG